MVSRQSTGLEMGVRLGLNVSIRRDPPTALRRKLSFVRTGALVSVGKDGGLDGDHYWG